MHCCHRRRQPRGVRTTRLCRTLSHRSFSALPASTATRPTFVAIMTRPSDRDGMAIDIHCFALLEKRNIFYFGLDKHFRKSEVICPSGNFVDCARLFVFDIPEKRLLFPSPPCGRRWQGVSPCRMTGLYPRREPLTRSTTACEWRGACPKMPAERTSMATPATTRMTQLRHRLPPAPVLLCPFSPYQRTYLNRYYTISLAWGFL
jgi:hypothetical protein